MRPRSTPRPIGTSMKALHVIAPCLRTRSASWGSSCTVRLETVEFTCTLMPSSRAVRHAATVRSKVPGTRRKPSCTSAEDGAGATEGGHLSHELGGLLGVQLERVAGRPGFGTAVHAGKGAGL